MRLRARLLLLIGAALLPAVAVQVDFERQTLATRAEAERSEAMRLARLVSADLESVIEGARQFLAAVGNVEMAATGDQQACDRSLAALLRDVPHYTTLTLTDAAGRITCSALARGRRAGYFRAGVLQPGAAGWSLHHRRARGRLQQRNVEPAFRPAPDAGSAWPGRHGDRGARPRLVGAAARGHPAAAGRHRQRRGSRRHHPRPLAGAGTLRRGASDAGNAAGDRRGRLRCAIRYRHRRRPPHLRRGADRGQARRRCRSPSASIPRRRRRRLPASRIAACC